MVTPLGADRETSWKRLIAGDTAGRLLTASEIDHFDQLSEMLGRVPGGAPVDHALLQENAERYCADQNQTDVFDTFGYDELNNLLINAYAGAMRHAGLRPLDVSPNRTGCLIGTSKSSLRAMESLTDLVHNHGKSDSKTFFNSFLPDAPLRTILSLLQSTGPASCPVAACATGLVSVIEAARLIHTGQCDVCIAGSGDASLRASVLSSFHRLGVTSRQSNPVDACRPFDVSRDGFIVGEGAAVFVLESRQHAEKRNADVLCQILSGDWMTDVTGVTQIDASGQTVSEIIRRVTDDGEGESPAPQCCSVHGTATETNDLAEAKGIRRAIKDAIPCFGIKGAIGHLLGAAGSVELATLILALRDGVLPETTNFTNTDPECPINVTHEAIPTSARSAMKLSLGFGGHVAACVIQK